MNSTQALISRLLLGIIPRAILILTASATNAGSSESALYQRPGATIEVVDVFDYPTENVLTLPERINNRGDISGTIGDIRNPLKTRGFIRLHDGYFTPPISEPKAMSATLMWGINDLRTACGFYYNSGDGQFHGFFVTNKVYSEFDVDGALGTDLYQINNSGNFCGDAEFDTGEFAFVSINGAVTVIDLPGAIESAAIGINNLNEVVGSYTDNTGTTHGYLRDSDGNITAPIDVAGATTTELRSINDNDVIVGRYYDSAGHQYGFALLLPDTFIVFNYTGASKTALNGVNDYNLMTGYYTDAATLVIHGVVARLR
jgi:hypothetical protein